MTPLDLENLVKSLEKKLCSLNYGEDSGSEGYSIENIITNDTTFNMPETSAYISYGNHASATEWTITKPANELAGVIWYVFNLAAGEESTITITTFGGNNEFFNTQTFAANNTVVQPFSACIIICNGVRFIRLNQNLA